MPRADRRGASPRLGDVAALPRRRSSTPADLGMSPEAIERFSLRLEEVVVQAPSDGDYDLEQQLRLVIEDLTAELSRTRRFGSPQSRSVAKVTGVFEVLGGALVIAGNAAAGAATAVAAPVTVVGAADLRGGWARDHKPRC